MRDDCQLFFFLFFLEKSDGGLDFSDMFLFIFSHPHLIIILFSLFFFTLSLQQQDRIKSRKYEWSSSLYWSFGNRQC
jgi:hypothetical protein